MIKWIYIDTNRIILPVFSSTVNSAVWVELEEVRELAPHPARRARPAVRYTSPCPTPPRPPAGSAAIATSRSPSGTCGAPTRANDTRSGGDCIEIDIPNTALSWGRRRRRRARRRSTRGRPGSPATCAGARRLASAAVPRTAAPRPSGWWGRTTALTWAAPPSTSTRAAAQACTENSRSAARRTRGLFVLTWSPSARKLRSVASIAAARHPRWSMRWVRPLAVSRLARPARCRRRARSAERRAAVAAAARRRKARRARSPGPAGCAARSPGMSSARRWYAASLHPCSITSTVVAASQAHVTSEPTRLHARRAPAATETCLPSRVCRRDGPAEHTLLNVGVSAPSPHAHPCKKYANNLSLTQNKRTSCLKIGTAPTAITKFF